MGYDSIIRGSVKVEDPDDFMNWLNQYKNEFEDGSIWYGRKEIGQYGRWFVEPFQDGEEESIDRGEDFSIITFNTDVGTHYGFDYDHGEENESFIKLLSKKLKSNEVASFIFEGEEENWYFYYIGKDSIKITPSRLHRENPED